MAAPTVGADRQQAWTAVRRCPALVIAATLAVLLGALAGPTPLGGTAARAVPAHAERGPSGDGRTPPPPPYPAPAAIVTVDWEADDQLVFLYDATTSAQPLADPHEGDWTGWGGGCQPGSIRYDERLPLFLGGGDRTDLGYNWSSTPGTYTITAVSNAYCVDDPVAAQQIAARYPKGSTVKVTARVESYAADSTTPEVQTFSASVPILLSVDAGGRRILGEVTVPAPDGPVPAPGGTAGPAGASSAEGGAGAATRAPGVNAEDIDLLLELVVGLGLAGVVLAALLLLYLRRAPGPSLGPPPTTGFTELGPDAMPTTVTRPARAWDGDVPILVPPGDYIAGHSQSGWTQLLVPDEQGNDRWVWAPKQAVNPGRVLPPRDPGTPSARFASSPGLKPGTYRPARIVGDSYVLVRSGETYLANPLPEGCRVLLGCADPTSGLVPAYDVDGRLLGWFENERTALEHADVGA
ncbi:MAG: hypothetical protein R2726_12185 [Acidimicrobiales bacterium]